MILLMLLEAFEGINIVQSYRVHWEFHGAMEAVSSNRSFWKPCWRCCLPHFLFYYFNCSCFICHLLTTSLKRCIDRTLWRPRCVWTSQSVENETLLEAGLNWRQVSSGSEWISLLSSYDFGIIWSIHKSLWLFQCTKQLCCKAAQTEFSVQKKNDITSVVPLCLSLKHNPCDQDIGSGSKLSTKNLCFVIT